MQSFIGIDSSTTATKALLIDEQGDVVAVAATEYPYDTPRPLWSEQDPEFWWTGTVESIRKVLADSGVSPDDVHGIGLTGQMHGLVLLDEQGKVLRPAILWNDQRSREESQHLRDKADARILEIGANRANPTWTLPQMLWLQHHEPESFARVRRLYVAKDWLRAQFTGTWETDTIDALGTLMLDAQTAEWSKELCDMIGWPMATLPPIVKPSAVVGKVTAKAALATGLAEGTPVVCGTSDTAAETFGAGMVREGIGVVKLATAATVNVLSPKARPDFSLINYYHVVPDHWYVIAATNSCASAHKWLRDTFFRREGEDGSAVFDAMDVKASAVRPGSEGLFFHPYLNGERSPYWDPLLRADFVGAGFNHGAGHFVRALYEGVAYSLRDCLDVMKSKNLGFTTARLTGGGARSALWRQIVADVLNITVELPAVADASFGAALLAGVGVGIFKDERAAAEVVKIVSRATPDPARAAVYDQGFPIYRDIQKALAPINHRIHAFVAGQNK